MRLSSFPRAVALLLSLLVLGSAAAFAPVRVTPSAAPLSLHDDLAARVLACGADAACKANAADALSGEAAARLGALPDGQAGVAAVVREALRDAGDAGVEPRATRSADLASALLRLYDVEGVQVDAALVRAQASRVAAPQAASLTALVDAVADARVASRGILSADDVALLSRDPAMAARLVTFDAPGSTDVRAALERVDRAALAEAALRLADAVSSFDVVPPEGCEPVLDLPFVFVGGQCSDDTYSSEYFLQVDYGGADRYLVGAGAGIAGVGVGVTLDYGGASDTYSAFSAAQGSAIAGAGILYDDGGSDSYTVTQFGQGCGVGGLGLLYDAGAGDDTYESPHEGAISTKATSLAGLGLLVDEGGSDVYHQDGLDGFVYGAAGGMGLLVEKGEGDDQYVSRDQFVSIIAIGDLGNFTGPVQVSAEAGGTAILYEEGGNDLYQCGDHVRQGCQGAAGVDALALLLDQGGDDQYRMGVEIEPATYGPLPILSMGQGGAYGLATPQGPALAVLRDLSGNDIYQAQMWAQGYGTAGLGALLDNGGADSYLTAAPLLGARADGQLWVDDAAGVGRDVA